MLPLPLLCLKASPVALKIKFRLPGLALKIVHDLASAAPPACLSPRIPQHPQSSAQIAVAPQT